MFTRNSKKIHLAICFLKSALLVVIQLKEILKASPAEEALVQEHNKEVKSLKHSKRKHIDLEQRLKTTIIKMRKAAAEKQVFLTNEEVGVDVDALLIEQVMTDSEDDKK